MNDFNYDTGFVFGKNFAKDEAMKALFKDDVSEEEETNPFSHVGSARGSDI